MNDRDDIVITGVGLASPVGDSAAATFAALLGGAAIVDHARVFAPSPRRGEGRGEGSDANRQMRSSSRTPLRGGTGNLAGNREPEFGGAATDRSPKSGEPVDSSELSRRGTSHPSPQPSPHWGEGAGERLVNLGHHVAIEALAEAGWSAAMLADPRTAIVVGTSKGPADDWLLPIDDGSNPPTSDKEQCEDVTSTTSVANNRITRFNTTATLEPASPINIRRVGVEMGNLLGLHVICESLASRLNLGIGPRVTYSAACASSLHALIRAAMLLQHGDADRAIVIGVESSLHPAFIQSFKRLGVIASAGEPCRPMDRNRSGFLISEAAAAICLERRPARAGEIVLDGWAIGADASHLTHTNPDAPTLRRCISTVLAARPVDLVHAHATGTVANDVLELAAIDACLTGVNALAAEPARSVTSSPGLPLERHADGRDRPAIVAHLTGANALAGEPAGPAKTDPGLPLESHADRRERPAIYSHKGAIGHSLGASGLVATVLNVMSHRASVVPGNVNTPDPLETTAGQIEASPIERPIRRSIAIAAGFGGATGVVGLRTV